MKAHFHNPEPLNADNAALVLVDHQVGLMTYAIMPALTHLTTGWLFDPSNQTKEQSHD